VIAAYLVLLVGQAAVARGDLKQLASHAQRMEVVVRLGAENWLTEPALRELRRWPVAPTLELRPPVSAREAKQLRKLKHFRARLAYGSPRDRTLRRLAPALTSVKAEPRTPLPVKDRPCPGTALMGRAGADEVLSAPDGIDQCVRGWLSDRFGPHRAEEP
jgi:hypothetical protein